jgi:hypothetical protein
MVSGDISTSSDFFRSSRARAYRHDQVSRGPLTAGSASSGTDQGHAQ